MKTLLLALVLMSAGISAFAETEINLTGDKILFQADSTYVSALYSKSLCKAGDAYKAVVQKCIETRKMSNDNDTCVKTISVLATQPVASTAQRCAEFSGHDQQYCARWETYAFVQSPVRNLVWANERGGSIVKTATIVIPNCSAVVGE